MKPSIQLADPRRIEWLDTGGGPFILVPRGAATAWGGSRAAGAPNDYERAKALQDYLGTITIGDASALVLGDDPFPTAYVPAPPFGGGYLVRMLWGEDLNEASTLVHSIAASAWTTEPTTFDAGRGDLVLIDAAHPGRPAPDWVDVPLCGGRFAVSTADWESDDMCLLVHRLVPVS